MSPPTLETTHLLRIRLLGDFELRLGETSLPPLESSRLESLLAYLLLHRNGPQSRQHLAFLLWPDSTDAQARTNLRPLVYTLRHTLPDIDKFLEVTPRTLRWRTEAPFWLDVAAFDHALARSERADVSEALAALRDAVALYAGDLLEGCYEEWILAEREHFRQRYLVALGHLSTLHEEHGNYTDAIVYAERLLLHDPLPEEVYRRLIRLHDARGDRARALRAYHVCEATLERELGVEPSPATCSVYEALLPI